MKKCSRGTLTFSDFFKKKTPCRRNIWKLLLLCSSSTGCSIKCVAGITDGCSSSAAAQSSLLDMSRYVLRCPDMSRDVKPCPEISRHVKPCPEISRHFKICPEMSNHVQRFPDIPLEVERVVQQLSLSSCTCPPTGA